MDNVKLLRLEDAPHILSFEKSLLAAEIEDEVEQEIASWASSWRQEALEHYLPLGWSFAKWSGKEGDSELLGYFLGQVHLFTQGETQSLWVERLNGKTKGVTEELIEVAYRLSREKHLQKVVFAEVLISEEVFSRQKKEVGREKSTDTSASEEILFKWKAKRVQDHLFEIKTTKNFHSTSS